MFREMRRHKQMQGINKAFEILNTVKRIVVSVNGDDGYPYCMFMNFYFDERIPAIYLHSADSGHRFDSLSKSDKVCLTTHDEGHIKQDDWAYTINSVVVFGRATIVGDESIRRDITYKLGCKYYPNEDDVKTELERDLKRMILYKIAIDHITCKQIHEK